MRLAYHNNLEFNCCLCDYTSDLDLESGHGIILKHLLQAHNRILVSYEDIRGDVRVYNGPHSSPTLTKGTGRVGWRKLW